MGRRQERASRNEAIEALRAFAAIGVALFHFSERMHSTVATALHGYGWLGVDVFFVVSGFVIPMSLASRAYTPRDFPVFMCRRLVRLEPPYLASIVLIVIAGYLSALAPGFHRAAPDYSLPQLASHLFYAIPLTSYQWISPVYWSLAYEFVFYIVVGLSFPLLLDRGPVIAVVTVTTLIISACVLRQTCDARLIEFVVGIFAARCLHRPSGSDAFLLAVAIGLSGAAGGLATGIAVGATVLLIIAARHTAIPRFVTFLGGISYSLYLTHVVVGGPLVNLGLRYEGGALYETGIILAALAGSVLFAAAFSRAIERPAMAASKAF
jgi:peptidoglycan/LPS O-acetylase OafA/YrhL